MVREIVFDTETTGLSPEQGHKIVEIGAIELINHMPTGKTYHQYINPLRDVPEEVVKVHGLTGEFLEKYPKFSSIAADFLEFIGDAVLVAHNASFDMNFINFELKSIGMQTIESDRVIDTLEIARKKFPGAKNNLDALCRRFAVDNSSRTKHGALLDSELLAAVYLELLGGAEPSMLLASKNEITKQNSSMITTQKKHREPRVFLISDEERLEHEDFLQNKIKNALWLVDNN